MNRVMAPGSFQCLPKSRECMSRSTKVTNGDYYKGLLEDFTLHERSVFNLRKGSREYLKV
jgi:hypothetical protein